MRGDELLVRLSEEDAERALSEDGVHPFEMGSRRQPRGWVQVAPERLDLTALYDNIRVLTNNAQKTSRFEIAFWNKVFYPAAVLVMMMLALPFAHFQRRQGGIGFRIFAGTIIGMVTAAAVSYLTFTRHLVKPDSAFGGWLMPVVPPMVSASTGALLLPYAPAGQAVLHGVLMHVIQPGKVRLLEG